jgi:hypothetical protein
MSSSDLAVPAFVTGIEEKLAAVDVYGASSGTEVGGATGAPDLPLNVDEIADLVGANVPTSASDLLSVGAGGLSIDTAQLKDNILASIPGAGEAMGDLGGLQDSVFSVGTGLSSEVSATVNGVTSLVNGANLSSMTGVGSLIGGITGSDFPISLKDNAGIAQVGTNLLNQACTLNIPGAYSQFSSGFSGDLGMLSTITKGVLPTVASTSNVGMLSEIATGPLAGSISSMMPGFSGSFTSSFKLPSGIGTTDIVKMGTQVFSSLNTIDPSWNKTVPISSRPMSTTYPVKNSSTATMQASPDFKTMMAVYASAKATPAVVTPIKSVTQPSTQVNSNFPDGTTSSAHSNSDGSTTTIYHLPDGTIVTRTTPPNATSVKTVSQYAPQIAPPPQPKATSTIYAAKTVVTPNVGSTAVKIAASVVNNLPSVISPSAFDIPNFGAGAYAVASQEAGGVSVLDVTLADGTICTQRILSADTVEAVVLQATSFDALSGNTEDPFANSAAATVEDPITMGYVISDAASQELSGDTGGAPPYLNMGAADALQASYPLTDLTGVDETEIVV